MTVVSLGERFGRRTPGPVPEVLEHELGLAASSTPSARLKPHTPVGMGIGTRARARWDLLAIAER